MASKRSSPLKISNEKVTKTLEHKRSAENETRTEWFATFAQQASRVTGKPLTFIIAVVLVIAWALTGPYFNYSDTWQLVINTSTTIITFLMVFLIQNTQNRDMLAVQVKLAELIIAVQGAKNRLATAEDMSEKDLEALHKHYCEKAEATRASLEARRVDQEKQSAQGRPGKNQTAPAK